ncbi:MAG TPA: peptide-methionine (R)-S-oxide reductase MsrB [Pyrinomonadaceae bacterium]|nr:peptide-methionine (R)-S-oxide reductase MsrB [Pyrinomonadaceae bacterium]
MDRRFFLRSGITLGAVAVLSKSRLASAFERGVDKGANHEAAAIKKVVKTDAEWKQILTPEQYNVTRRKGTEPPYTSPLLKVHEKGVFECVCCELPLFSSSAKFESGTGWPSFWTPISKRNVREEADDSLGEWRIEVLCARCDAHLGHVFEDGPRPTGLRYCMNGVSLKFVKSDKSNKRS